MSARWDSEFAKHQWEQEQLRRSRRFRSYIKDEVDHLGEDSQQRWSEAKTIYPDRDE